MSYPSYEESFDYARAEELAHSAERENGRM